MIGFSFLIGVVLGCLTIARLGDIYGRRPIYLLGLFMHLAFSICIFFVKNNSFILLYALLIFLGMSVTARYYVGYTYNLEMQPKENQALVSTFMFVCESFVYIFVCFYFSSISKEWLTI